MLGRPRPRNGSPHCEFTRVTEARNGCGVPGGRCVGARPRMHRLLVSGLFLLHACAAPAVGPVVPTAIELEGKVTWEAHLERPHATCTFDVSVRLQCAGAAARCELSERSPSREEPEVTVYLRAADGTCWVRESGRERFARD